MSLKQENIDLVKEKYTAIKSCLNEKGRRLWGATEAKSYGRGGVKLLCNATGISNKTVHKGLKELDISIDTEGVRKKGGGRKRSIDEQPKLLSSMELIGYKIFIQQSRETINILIPNPFPEKPEFLTDVTQYNKIDYLSIRQLIYCTAKAVNSHITLQYYFVVSEFTALAVRF